MDTASLIKRVRYVLGFFILAVLVSGVTAFPLTWGASLLDKMAGEGTFMEATWPAMAEWVSRVHVAIVETGKAYPFMFYGTDWLAFAHIVIAVAFIGPLRDPVRNIWVVEFGMIACVLVIPLAMICGPIRGIPFFWRVIDCSFGVVGIVPLWLARRDIRRIIAMGQQGAAGRA